MTQFLRTAGAALIVASMGATAASAADMPEIIDATKVPFDVAFGVKGGNDYLVRGITQTDGKPAIQGYVELRAFDWIYAGVAAANVGFGTGGPDAPNLETDWYGGVRHSFGALPLDAGYVWIKYYGKDSLYPKLDYGKAYGVVSYALTDQFTVGANVFYGGDFINMGVKVVHSTAFAKYAFTPIATNPDLGAYISGSLSKQWTTKNFVKDYVYWDAGAGLTYKAMTFDVRYSDTNLSKRDCLGYMGDRNWCGSRFVASLSFDTSLNKLK